MTANVFLLSIALLTTLLVYLHRKISLLHKLPLILLLYMSFMLLGNLNLWDAQHTEVHTIQKQTVNNLLPAMIFLMMLGFDLSLFKQLGSKMLLAFFSTTLSLILAFVSLYYLFNPYLWEGANISLATLSGSWNGGSINMVAIGKIVGISDSAMADVIVVDTIAYTMWVMFLLLLVPFAKRFNAFTKASIQEVSLDMSCCIQSDLRSYIRIILISIIVALCVNIFAVMLPTFSFISTSFYTVILATLLGLIASKSTLKKLPFQGIANTMLYLIIALIASQANIVDFSTTLVFLAFAFAVLILHALIMLFLAKLFKLDLFSIGIASLAHIGGTAGATILASTYNKNLIPVAVVMATAGYLLGTFVGIFVATLLGV